MSSKWAVVIGINGYHESLGPLNYSVNDCRRLTEVLTTGDDAFPAVHVLVLTDDEAAERKPTYASIHSWLASWLAQPDELPLMVIAISAVVGIAVADSIVTYMTACGLAHLASGGFYATMMYLLCVIVVVLLARCHPSHVVLKEAFQAFSFHLPNFLMLILGTSIILSVFRWATGIGPYRFGFLSISLTVLVIGLSAAILYKGNRTATGAGESDISAESQTQAALATREEAGFLITQEDDERDRGESSL